MKIDIVIPFFYPVIGGAEIYGYELSRKLVSRGYDVEVHTVIYDLKGNIYKNFEIIDGVKVIRYKPIFKKFYYYWFWVPKINKTDIIHVCGYGHVCFSLTIQKYKKEFPLVATTMGVSALIEGSRSRWLRKQYDRFIGINQLKLLKKIITWAEEEKNWCIERGIPISLIKRIPIGIPEESFYFYDPKDFKSKYNLDRYILYLGRIHIQKGIDTLIKAFSLIHKEFNVKLVLIGPDNAYVDRMIYLAKEYNIIEKIVWIDSLYGKEKYEAISGCEFIVLPSKYELQGIVLCEAMAQRKPVIATKVGGIPDFVVDGVNGFLVEYGDIISLADRMKKLLSCKQLYTKMSLNAKKTAEEFKWERIIKEYEQIFSEVL
ncbi:MAG: glycosyltransferase family 4 protein [Elusimicrobiota bacterium]|nr:glycosyltransferase family 4 protein [Endomicrobiia bacterium]MDW8166438.1 glycosyltransferase family 4 protein [Elusimicrobiota bacterium]